MHVGVFRVCMIYALVVDVSLSDISDGLCEGGFVQHVSVCVCQGVCV